MLPDPAYLVCATPRSGSTLLCELLRGTGVAGTPLEHFEVLRHSGLPRQPREYFEGLDDPEVTDRLAPLRTPDPVEPDPGAWWQGILEEGSTDNGVWGGKLMWGHTGDFIARAAPVSGAGTLLGTLRRLLGDVRFVFVSRPDTVAQAVSLWKAVQTQEWREGTGEEREPEYSFSAIGHLVRQLRHQDEAWQQWFAESAVEPHAIVYEELNADPRAAAASVLSLLGVAADVPEPELRRQGDELSQSWVERYRAEAGAAA